MILTIHQPEHLPWMGFFNKMSFAETLVILDNVQFRKNYFQNRNRIKGSNGVQWIGIPVETRGSIEKRICDIKTADVSNPKWREKYMKTIEYSYNRHPHYERHYPFFNELMSENISSLSEINIRIIIYFAGMLKLRTKLVMASDMDTDGTKTDLILDICKKMNAKTYVAGPSGRDYLNLSSFKEAGIKVVFNDFVHPEYEQYKEERFIPYLSILDLFMNVDAGKAGKIAIEKKYWSNE